MPLITLLTDFGLADAFVGVIHGVIAQICPEARVIDLTHNVPRYNVGAGAGVLEQSLAFLPVGVHLAVVDPGVGGERRALALRTADGRTFVGPDNGLLWPACEAAGGIVDAVEVAQSPWRLEPVSATFHGRDIFAPVAAHLASGGRFSAAGAAIDPSGVVRLQTQPAWIESGALVVRVIGSDRYGNLQLGATRTEADQLGLALGGRVTVRLTMGESYPASFVRTFSEVEPDALLLFEDSSRRLALGLNQGSAAGRLGLQIGDELRIASRP
jgi:S-adenosylmethionine hydrolase